MDVVIKNLNFSYDKFMVLNDINLDYNVKDFLAIIGPNGGGKSTLLKLILGLLTPTSGNIEVFGNAPKLVSKNLAYVPQNTIINSDFPASVFDVVLMGRLKKGFYTKEDKIKAQEALEMVGMSEFKKRKIGELSGGQTQKVFIARALSGEAKLILLDEPTASIDTNGQIQIYSLLKQINQTKGIIIISHDLNVSLGYATKIAYVSKSLYMHDFKNEKTRNNILNLVSSYEGHICPVEIIASNLCECEK